MSNGIGVAYLPMRTGHMWAYGKSRIPPTWFTKIPGEQGLGNYVVPPEMWPGLRRVTPTGYRSALGCCGGDDASPGLFSNPWVQLGLTAAAVMLLMRFIA